MEKITTSEQLIEAIRLLEIKLKEEGTDLKNQLETTFDSIKPANLILKTISDLNKMPDIKEEVLATLVGYGVGYAVHKMVVGTSDNNATKMAGNLLQIGVSKLVASKSKGMTSTIMDVFKTYSQRENDEEKKEENNI
jgi:hypothetical protein